MIQLDEKYLKQGISIVEKNNGGYTVFTVYTQHFDIESISELTNERFEEERTKFLQRDKIQNELWETYVKECFKK